jgi:hypothetical protein
MERWSHGRRLILVLIVQLYRLLWMYISLYKFAGVSDVRERYLWDPAWRPDVGHIALNTPPIVIAAGTAAECEKLETGVESGYSGTLTSGWNAQLWITCFSLGVAATDV